MVTKNLFSFVNTSTDWQYQTVAQACDRRTAVGLARHPEADQRFFRPPPRPFDKQEVSFIQEVPYVVCKTSMQFEMRYQLEFVSSEWGHSRKFHPWQDSVEEELQTLISKLPTRDVDKCTRFFTKDALGRGKTPSSESVRKILCSKFSEDF